jgi:hypothetical protein
MDMHRPITAEQGAEDFAGQARGPVGRIVVAYRPARDIPCKGDPLFLSFGDNFATLLYKLRSAGKRESLASSAQLFTITDYVSP